MPIVACTPEHRSGFGLSRRDLARIIARGGVALAFAGIDASEKLWQVGRR